MNQNQVASQFCRKQSEQLINLLLARLDLSAQQRLAW
jgi:hypothetical protein